MRYDAPGDDPTAAGQRGKMYNNVAINTSGIMVKGDHHYIANNTVIGSNKNGMIILDEENSNLNTNTLNNLVDKLSGHRSNSNYEDRDGNGIADYPVPGTSSNNWNGWDSVRTSSIDESKIDNTIYNLIDSVTLMPLDGSPLIDAGIFIEEIPMDTVGSSPDIGAFEYGIEPWKAGYDGWYPRYYPWTFMSKNVNTKISMSGNNLYEDSTNISISFLLEGGAHDKDIILEFDTMVSNSYAEYGKDWIIIYEDDSVADLKTLIWEKGKDSITLNVHAINDNIYEKNETLLAGIIGISVDKIAFINSGIYGTLYDNDQMPTASASLSVDSISENSETKNIKLTLSNPSKFDIMLGLSVEDSPFVPEDLAENKKDFSLDVDTLVFPALSTEQEFNITSIQDDEIESNELAVINIESIEDSIFLTLSIVIIDDDQPLPLSIESKNFVKKVFPNPSSDNLRINVDERYSIEGISFIDIKGKKHNPKNITRNSTYTDVNISNLDEGIYILNIQVDKEVLKVKVVINR